MMQNFRMEQHPSTNPYLEDPGNANINYEPLTLTHEAAMYEVPDTFIKGHQPTTANQIIPNQKDSLPTHSDLRKVQRELQRSKKCLMCLIFVTSAILLLVSLAALALAVFAYQSTTKAQPSPVQSSQLLSSDGLELVKNVQFLNNFTVNLQEQLHFIHTQVNSSISQIYSQLQQTVSTNETVSIRSEISNLRSQVNAIQITTVRSDITQLRRDISSAQSSLSSLTTQIRSPVNLYQNCTQDTRICTITGSRIRIGCLTTYSQLNVQGVYTLGVSCGLRRTRTGLEVATLIYSTYSTSVACLCAFVYPSTSGHNSVTNNSPYPECVLTVTRCPLSRNVFT